MDYICHKVGLLFPLCETCNSYKECEKEARPAKTQESIQIHATAEAPAQ